MSMKIQRFLEKYNVYEWFPTNYERIIYYDEVLRV